MFKIVDASLQSFDCRSTFFYRPISSPTRLSDIAQFDFFVSNKKEDRKQRVVVKYATIMIRNDKEYMDFGN